MFRKLVYIAILPLVGMSQDIPKGVKYDLTDLIYPRVARLARIQGVVTLQLTPGETGQEIKLINGSAYLVREPTNNLSKWRTDQPVTVNYIFRLRDPDISKTRVPKGDAFDRMILGMFHLATYTVEYHCKQSSGELIDPRVVKESPLILDVEVLGG